mgnify:CR=1 FL=1
MKKRLSTILLILIFLIGLSLLLYPTVSDYWNSLHQSRAIAEYAEQVANLDDDLYEGLWAAAQRYNETLLDKADRYDMTEEERAEYESLLNVSGNGIIGYIEIPMIQCSLPIYHGTEESVLQIAVGHIEGSSLPTGGAGTHCVLSGHRGLPSALLFSDLDQMQLGDHFSLRILGEQLLYEVDQILVVEPDEVKDLYPVEGEDLVTLVTCTPYGVNTHRLLVRGHRIPLETVEETVEVTVTQQVVHSLGWKGKLLIGALLLFLLILLILALLRRKRKKTGPEEGNVVERGRTDEKASQSRSGPDPDHTAVSPRDSTDSRS